MKVLNVFNELKPSGAEVMMKCSFPFWQVEGIEAEILTTGETPGPYAPVLEKAGYRIHHLPFRKSPRFFYNFAKLLKKEKYDVVHIHCEQASFYYGITARLSGIRVVRTVHSFFNFSGFLRFRRSLQRNVLRHLGCTYISIGPSVHHNELVNFFNPTSLIPNWYDSRRFLPPSEEDRQQAREQAGIRTEDFVILSVGNCEPVKNHEELLKALAQIQEIPFIYLHVGREKEGFPERQTAKSLGIEGRIRFLGYLEDILPVLHAADIYVMPSLREGFSVAAIEALGAGLPSVLTNVPGLQDLKFLEGLCWAEPQANSLRQHILALYKLSESQRRTIGEQLQQSVQQHYGIEGGTQAYAAIYRGEKGRL